jgi:cytochrome c oxidase cbb3-type subunit III
MKSINKILFASLMILLTAVNIYIFKSEASGGHDLEKVLRTMLVLSLVMIVFVIWLAVVYSEKNDNDGESFKAPFNAFTRFLTRSVPMEKEKEIMFHHDFDGIQELDNRIPPWFSFLFFGTIIWGIIYMLVFHVFDDGQIQSKEYNTQMQQASIEREILIKSGAFINEETVTSLSDAAALAEGKEIFSKNCVTCHAADGGGLVGPNLTDDFWIHGGGIKNVFKTIKNGVPAKGMISWQAQLDPKKIQAVASYVLTLHDTKPANPKAQEGSKWEEPKTDSMKVASQI